MSRVLLEDACFSFPIRISHRRELGKLEGAHDPRILLDRSKKPRYFQVLRNISFELKTGDRLAIIGRNGSGKSTLLRLIHGVYLPDYGRRELEGETDALFELNAGVRPLATGYQNIIYGGLMRGHHRDLIEEKAPEIAEFSQLGEFIHLPISTYSAGMRMRLLFGIATAFDPDILLLDEWISAGDAQFRAKAEQRMNDLVERAGIIVLASHSFRLLRATCNKALWLEQGKIVRFGDMEEVFHQFDEAIQKGIAEIPSH